MLNVDTNKEFYLSPPAGRPNLLPVNMFMPRYEAACSNARLVVGI